MEDDDDDVTASNDEVNSSLAEGAVTRALYGDEQGIVCVCVCVCVRARVCVLAPFVGCYGY